MRPSDVASLPILLARSGVLLEGNFRLASGAFSDWYVDVRRAITVPEVLSALVDGLAGIIGPTDFVAGIELTGAILGALVAHRLGLPLIVVRKHAKDHGTGRLLEGTIPPGRLGLRAVCVDDVVTSGGTGLRATRLAREAGLVVNRLVAVVDRHEGGTEALAGAGVQVKALLSDADLAGLRVQRAGTAGRGR